MNNLLNALDKAWDEEAGFLFGIRNRNFDEKEGLLLLEALRSYLSPEEACIDRDLVRLLWFIPLYMEYQTYNIKQAFDEETLQKYQDISNQILDEVSRILGYP